MRNATEAPPGPACPRAGHVTRRYRRFPPASALPTKSSATSPLGASLSSRGLALPEKGRTLPFQTTAQPTPVNLVPEDGCNHWISNPWPPDPQTEEEKPTVRGTTSTGPHGPGCRDGEGSQLPSDAHVPTLPTLR